VIHNLTANIGEFGFWTVSDEFFINVQDDSTGDESSSDSSSSMESDSELAQTLQGNFNYKHCNSLDHSFFEGRMFSRWIVTNITSARVTLRCHKTRIPCEDQLVICGLYRPTAY
jgi:hypothetical protein